MTKYDVKYIKADESWALKMFCGEQNWARKWIISLCDHNNHFLSYLLDRDFDFVHLICLVKLYNPELSPQIAGHYFIKNSNRIILNNYMPNSPTWMLRVLKKLDHKVYSKKSYSRLGRIAEHILLGDQTKNKTDYLKHTKTLSEQTIKVIDEIDENRLSCALIESIKEKDVKLLNNLLFIINNYLILSDINNKRHFSKITSLEKLNKWVYKTFIKQFKFIDPPWVGDGNIIPISSAKDLKRYSLKFKNCIMDYLYELVKGDVYFYYSDKGPCIILIKRFLDSWHIDTITGINNKWIGDENYSLIHNTLTEVGINDDFDAEDLYSIITY